MLNLNHNLYSALEQGSNKTINSLEQLFFESKKLLVNEFDLKRTPEHNCSHFKRLLFDEKLGDMLLKLELIYFTGLEWTGPHIHPEFVLDEVLTGELLEQIYNKQGTNYNKDKLNIRPTGDFRAIYDPQGHPHNVIAKDGPSCVLCLSLGKNSVTSIHNSHLTLD